MRHKIYCTSANDNRQIAVRQLVNEERKQYTDTGVGGVNGGYYAMLGDDSYYLVGSVMDAVAQLEPKNYDIDRDEDYSAVKSAITDTCELIDDDKEFLRWCEDHNIKITAKMRKEMDSWWSY